MSETNQSSDKCFLGVRQAFRLLDQFQKTLNSIVYYVRDCSVYKEEYKNQNNIYAFVWYKNVTTRTNVKNRSYRVTAVAIYRDGWGWAYLPCYFVEHVLGDESIDGNYCLRFSIFQVSDDGSFVSEDDAEKYEEDWNFTSKFKPAEESESWLILSAELYAVNKKPKLWLRNNPQNETKYPDDEQYAFINEFILSKDNEYFINTNKELDDIFVIKKYKMAKFSSKREINDVIRDFGQLIKNKKPEWKIFLDNFINEAK